MSKIYFSWNQEFHLTHTLFLTNFNFVLFFPGYTRSCGMCTGNPVGKKPILWRKPSQPEMQGQIARQISTRLSIDPWPVRAVPVTKTERCKGAGGPRGAGLSPPIWTTQQQRVVSWWVIKSLPKTPNFEFSQTWWSVKSVLFCYLSWDFFINTMSLVKKIQKLFEFGFFLWKHVVRGLKRKTL